MKAMSKFWMALVVGVAVMAAATQSWAVPLSNTNISWTVFTNLADVDNPVVPPLFSPYEFSLQGSPLGDGVFYSQVFPGIGDAAGLYVYVYQIQVSREPEIEGVSLGFITNPTQTPVGADNITSFYIGSGPPDPPIGFNVLGNYAPDSADWLPSLGGTLRFNQINVPTPGTSYIFGTFSPLPPTTIDVTLRDATTLLVRPLAYVPTPEPSSAILFGLGLMGLGIMPVIRRRKTK